MARYESLKALNEGFFHLLVLGMAIYLVSRHARFPLSGKVIEPGDIVTFSLLFYRVRHPIKTLSFLLDNIQEYNLRVDDLLQMLAQPIDRSFMPVQMSLNLSMMERVADLYERKRLPSRSPAKSHGWRRTPR